MYVGRLMGAKVGGDTLGWWHVIVTLLLFFRCLDTQVDRGGVLFSVWDTWQGCVVVVYDAFARSHLVQFLTLFGLVLVLNGYFGKIHAFSDLTLIRLNLNRGDLRLTSQLLIGHILQEWPTKPHASGEARRMRRLLLVKVFLIDVRLFHHLCLLIYGLALFLVEFGFIHRCHRRNTLFLRR